MSPLPTFATMLALCGLVFSFTAPASASGHVYTRRSEWQSVTILRVDRDFDDLPAARQFQLRSPYVDQGASFFASNDYLYSWGPGCCNGRDAFGTGGSWLIGPWNDGNLEVTLPPNTTSVGFDLAAYNGYPPSFIINVRTKSGQYIGMDLHPPKNQYAFWGFTYFGEPLISVTITSLNGNNVVLDNVSTGASVAP